MLNHCQGTACGYCCDIAQAQSEASTSWDESSLPEHMIWGLAKTARQLAVSLQRCAQKGFSPMAARVSPEVQTILEEGSLQKKIYADPWICEIFRRHDSTLDQAVCCKGFRVSKPITSPTFQAGCMARKVLAFALRQVPVKPAQG